MKPSRLALLLTILFAFPAWATAQDFTGEWTLVESVGGDAALSSPLGDRGSITYATDTITISPTLVRSNAQGERTYRLDGSETRYNIKTAGGGVLAKVARVRRTSAALVIEDAWDVITLSLNSSGQLEMLIVSENLWPSGTAETCRFIYRKTR